MKSAFTYGFLLMTCTLVVFTLALEAQNTDTLRSNTEFLTNQLENLSRAADRTQDYSDLTGDFLYYARHPVNVNTPEVAKLVELHLLNEMQLTALQNYILQNGIIYSLYELRYVTGFDALTIRKISPFIKTGKPERASPFSLKKIFRYGEQQLLARYTQVLEKAAGYRTPADSAWQKPGSVFLGNPQNIYLRYAFRAGDRMRWGMTAENDAGEVLFANHLGDSVRKLLGKPLPRFPDFFSAYGYVSHLGIIKKAIVGDYHLEFGQGLCLWSGLTFGKSAEATEIKYYGTGIRPNTSANENRFFRGAAVTLGLKKFNLTLFYSHHATDATLVTSSEGKPEVSGLPETGLHRTINEWRSKHNLNITAFGGHLSYNQKNWTLGATWYRTLLSLPLEPPRQLYRLFAFRGKQLTNAAVNASLHFNRIFFFGEMAASQAKGLAGVAGITVYPTDRLTLTLFYRNLSPAYHVLYASPFVESGQVSNEQGLYLGIKMLLSKHFRLSAYADYYRFPWLKFRINAPSFGKAFLVQLDMQAGSALSMYFRFRYSQKEENNNPDWNYLPSVDTKSTADFRYHLEYLASQQLMLKIRVEYVRYTKTADREQGFLAYQDVQYRFLKIPLSMSLRYALFDTDGWNSRLYAYENDVLYAFTIPPFYDKGQRFYFLLHYRFGKHFESWLKVARTLFFHKDVISSGPEAITGNHKTSVRIQLRLKF
jgi:hypothetical protein